MPPEMRVFRDAALDAVRDLGPMVELWRFEDRGPAVLSPNEFYLRAVESSDLLLVVIGDDMSQPTMEEVRHAIDCKKDVLALILGGRHYTADVCRLVDALRGSGVTTAEVAADGYAVRGRVVNALASYIINRFRLSPSSLSRSTWLEELERAAKSRLQRGWQVIGLPDHVSRTFAADTALGVTLELRATVAVPGVVIVNGPLGAGKSTAMNRLLLDAVWAAQSDALAPLPVWLTGREVRSGLRGAIDRFLGGHGAIGFVGARVFVDELDAEDPVTIAALVREAETVAESLPSTAVIFGMRRVPTMHSARVYEVPELGRDQIDLLVRRISDEAASVRLALDDYPRSIQVAIRRPLFLILTALETERSWHTRRPEPASEAQLLEALIVAALGPSLPNVSEDVRLQELAEILTDGGLESIAVHELRNPVSRAVLLGSTLVVGEQGEIGFALPVIREWLAAQRLMSMTADQVIDKVKPLRNADRWYYPLKLFVAMSPATVSFEVTCGLASSNPALAMIIAREAWGDPEYHPNFATIGHKMRVAMRALRAAFPLLVPRRADGDVASVLCAAPSRLRATNRFRYGWFREAEPVGADVVTEVRPGEQNTILRRTGVITETDVVQDALFPFRASAASVLDAIETRLSKRTFEVDDDALTRESRWLDFLALSGKGVWCNDDQPISLEEIARSVEDLPPENVMLIGNPNRLINVDVVRKYVDDQLRRGIQSEPFPTVPADLPRPESYLNWEVFTDEALTRRVIAVYSDAMRIYAKIVDLWLPALAPILTRRILLPAKILLRLHRAEDGSPLAEDAFIPLPLGSKSTVEAAWGSLDERSTFHEMHAAIERYRDATNPRINEHITDGVVEIFGPCPVHDVVYGWLSIDLKEFLELGF
jgi:hypothetical protein